MCGIFGVLHARRDVSRIVSGMSEILAHRGPDDKGIEAVPGGLIGHRRLSIIDLSPAAAQPLWDVDRLACIVYNGEVYNFRELRLECLAAGLEFRSTSDTEVIVNQYLLHGRNVFDRLNGIFALCIYDARSGEFFLARDPMGVKPLYWAATQEGFVFASELKALLTTGMVSAEVDRAALQAYLQLDFVPAPMAIVSGVKKLREGHHIRIDPGGDWQENPYSSLNPCSAPATQEPAEPTPVGPSLADDVAEFDRRIHRTVAAQLVADVPVGVFLSGGIDSSIVAQVAAEVSGAPIATFSIGFEDRSFDESKYFSAVATAINSEHHVEVLKPATLIDLLPEIPRVACEPLADGSIFPTFLLSRFVSRHVKVALSGDGADELFAGYPTYYAAALARRLGPRASRLLRSLLPVAHALLPVSHRNLSLGFKIKKFLAGLDPNPILRNARWLGSFLPEELPGLLLEYHPDHQIDLQHMLHEPSLAAPAAPLERLLRTDQRFYLQDGVLVKVDRASMANGLEVRVPFLDSDIVSFARALAPERKLAGRDFKHLLKQYARGRLPAAVLQRPKKGFGTPLGRWFRNELRDLVGDVLAPRRIRDAGFFRPEAVSRLLEDHWRGRRDNRKPIFNLLTFAMWHESLLRRS